MIGPNEIDNNNNSRDLQCHPLWIVVMTIIHSSMDSKMVPVGMTITILTINDDHNNILATTSNTRTIRTAVAATADRLDQISFNPGLLHLTIPALNHP